jgi:hypothetical protein
MDNTLEMIEASAYKGFTIKETAHIIGKAPKEFELLFSDENIDYVIAYKKGLYQAQADLRAQIMQSALSGSSPAQSEMKKYLDNAAINLNLINHG